MTYFPLRITVRFASALLALAAAPAIGAESWTGFYAGLGVSGSKVYTDVANRDLSSYLYVEWSPSEPGPPNQLFNFGAAGDGTSLGITSTFGYGIDARPLFVGVEGAIDLGSSVERSEVICSGELCALAGNSSNLQRLGHTRALAGVILSNELMLFASGGVTLARATATTYSSVALHGQVDEDVASTQKLAIGLTVGLGADYRPTEGFRIRVEGVLDRYRPMTHRGETETRVEDGWETVGAGGKESFQLLGASSGLRLSALWEF